MNKIIKSELGKVDSVKIDFDDNTTKIFIPKKVEVKISPGEVYLIKLSDYMLNPPDNDVININWNMGNIPKFKYYKSEINKVSGNMVNITGVGYDISTNSDINQVWSGWLPRTEFEIMEKI